MVPDAELQLDVALKALREVVLPAVDPANGVAIEQLHLAMMTIGLVRERLPLRHRRARQELRNALDMAERLAALGAGGEAVASLADAARGLLADPAADEAALSTVRCALLAALEAVVAASGGDVAIARAVVAASKAQTDLARAWCLPAGFEVGAEDLPALDTLLV